MSGRKIYLLLVVLLEWFALVAQLILMLRSGVASTGELLARFFTYFTILTNILIGVYVTILFLADRNTSTGFSSPSAQTAFTLYITVVGLIYNLVLRQLWDPSGLQAVLDELLHSVIPVMILIYWVKWVDTGSLRSKNIPPWLVYPAVYAAVILIRGYYSGWYPYPFMDVNKLGGWVVARNCFGIVGVFLLFSFLFVLLGRRKNRRAGAGWPI